MKKIKILHVAASTAGGVGLILLHLTRALNKDRFEQTVVCGPGYPLDKEFQKNDLDIRFISLSRSAFSLKNLLGLFQIYQLLGEERFDIVHTHTSVGGFCGRVAAKLRCVPLTIWEVHGYGSHRGQGFWKGRTFLAIERFLDYCTDHYVAISESMRREGIEKKIMSADKISVIYNTINLDRFNRPFDVDGCRKDLGIAESGKIIGTIARLEPQKGIDHFVNAVALIKKYSPSCKFIIAGDGPLRKRYEDQARKLGVREDVLFLGWRDDIPELLSVMDVFCVPSLWEGFGLVLLEAMAMKKPIVASNVEGIAEIVRNGETGILVEPANPRAIADGVIGLLKDHAMALKVGSAARARVETVFSPQRMNEQYEELYERLLTTRKPYAL